MTDSADQRLSPATEYDILSEPILKVNSPSPSIMTGLPTLADNSSMDTFASVGRFALLSSITRT